MKPPADYPPPSPTSSAAPRYTNASAPRYTNVGRSTTAFDSDDDARLAIQVALTTRKREGLQAELRWEAELELKRKREYEAAHAAQLELNLRIEARQEKQEQERQQQNEARALREQAMAERLRVVAAEEVAKRRSAEQKIAETEERMQQNLRRREQDRADARRERQRRTAENAERGMCKLQVELDRKLQKQDEQVAREEQNKERLGQIAQETEAKVLEHRAKYSAAMDMCQEKAAKRQQEIEEVFLDRVGKYERFRSLGQECLETKATKVRDTRTRSAEPQAANRVRLRQEKNTKMKSLKAGAENSLTNTLDRREQHLKTIVTARKEKRSAMAALVDQNRGQIHEKSNCGVSKAVAQLEAERAVALQVDEQRKQHLDTRMTALRDHMLNRVHADEIKSVIRSGVQRNVNRVLTDLGMAPDAGKAASEEKTNTAPSSPRR